MNFENVKEKKKTNTNGHIIWFHLYEMPRISISMKTESRLPGNEKRVELGVTAKRYGVSCWGSGNVLALDSGDGCTAL